MTALIDIGELSISDSREGGASFIRGNDEDRHCGIDCAGVCHHSW